MKKENRKLYLIFTSILIILLIISMNSGMIKLSLRELFEVLTFRGDEKAKLILFHFRLPRILISMLIGIALSISGTIIQSVTKNPLSDPGILGINAGASLLVILYVLLFGYNSIVSALIMPIIAFVGAGISAFIIYKLSSNKKNGFSPINLVLTGVAMQAGLSALTTILVVKLDETQFNFVMSWQAGSIWASNYKFVLIIFLSLVIILPFIFKKSEILDLLNLSDEVSKGLGLDVELEQKKILLASVFLAASSVAVGGNISFVGLISPHLARKLVGPRHEKLLPTAAFVGAILVLLADTIGRIVFQPSEIPTGIIVSVIGTPYFLYLLKRKKR